MLTYTIGEMLDRLVVTNLKIWHLEEEVQKLDKLGRPAKEIEILCDKIVNANALRMKIVKAIDEFFEEK